MVAPELAGHFAAEGAGAGGEVAMATIRWLTKEAEEATTIENASIHTIVVEGEVAVGAVVVEV